MLREKIGRKETSIVYNDVRSRFEKIIDNWMKNPIHIDKREKYQGTTLQAIKEVFGELKDLSLDQARPDLVWVSNETKLLTEKKEEQKPAFEDILAYVKIALPEGKNVQYVEGFSEIVSYSNSSGSYADYDRGAVRVWHEYYDSIPQEVTWKTALCHQKRDTVFVFTGANGEQYGRAKLFLNGEYALTFESGIMEDKGWQEGNHKLFFDFQRYYYGNTGIYYLIVPAEEITLGEGCQIKVSHISGGSKSWFMIKDYKQTINFEKLRVE